MSIKKKKSENVIYEDHSTILYITVQIQVEHWIEL